MKKFAVAYFSCSDNGMELMIVKAKDWRDALVVSTFVSAYTVEQLPDDQNRAQEEAFNQDWQFAVKEVK